MSERRRRPASGTMLELWRPPRGAGEAVGCLTTTYTFDPGLFDEQCLARFLEVESLPNRENLAFLLEREMRLGAAYAGVLVDHTQAGVEHSLRWDVLPVRIRGGKQHAKLTLLAWTRHVRIIVASANLTKPGYRVNREVAIGLDFTPERADVKQIEAAVEFLRCLLAFVPGARPNLPEIQRARQFLKQVQRQVDGWKQPRRSGPLRQHLVFTLPGRNDNPATDGDGFPGRSTLTEAIAHCRRHGGSPCEAWIASPFFDTDSGTDAATAALAKAMARGARRRLVFYVPLLHEPEPLRLAAPESLRTTPNRYSAVATFRGIRQQDKEKDSRPWHAKMLAFRSETYTALLVGSSNFTRAGLGIETRRNAEANVLSIAERGRFAREPAQLEAIWPEATRVDDPESAEWCGPKPELDEAEGANSIVLPAGFLSATYRAGDRREIVFQFDTQSLPETWFVRACGRDDESLLNDEQWSAGGRKAIVRVPWPPIEPPEKLLVTWPAGEAPWTLNVENASQLPPPADLREMSADDMLLILAASDPSAAFRAWTGRQIKSDGVDDDLDTAIPIDLDPLRRYDLRATFLRRIRSRALVLTRVKQNLQRPVWSRQALQWRLEGFIGIEPLAKRMRKDVVSADGQLGEAVLALADLLIVLCEIEYEPVEGALPKPQFGRVYRPFLRRLAKELDKDVRKRRGEIDQEVMYFWNQVVERCLK